jgi:medium-chain acyl-[acyl-carrier-protein] hydrolase
MKIVKVFFIPFAGGSSYSYNLFRKYSSLELELIPIELPGRGTRIAEPLITDAHELVTDIFNKICNKLNEAYIIYGHSMGALLAFLLVRKIVNSSLPKPLHLIVTGSKAPSVRDATKRHLLPEEEFILELKRLGGSPDELLRDRGLLNFFIPILRADFEATETYLHKVEPAFDIPITVAIGKDEEITFEEALAWERETKASVKIRQFPGKHFFIFDWPAEIAALLSEAIESENEQIKI